MWDRKYQWNSVDKSTVKERSYRCIKTSEKSNMNEKQASVAQHPRILQLDGSAGDDSLAASRIGYAAFNMNHSAGRGFAPCATLVQMYINGKYDGVRTLIENVSLLLQ